MYMAQPGHIDHIKQINAGRVYKLIDQKGQSLASIYRKRVSLRQPVLPNYP